MKIKFKNSWGIHKYSPYINDKQFKLIEKYLPKVKKRRPQKYSRQSMLNAALYVLKTGCQWRELPDIFPPFRLVHKYFRKLCICFSMDSMIKNLNVKLSKWNTSVPYPDFMIIIDSKTIRTSEYFDKRNCGYDGNKKIYGIKLCPVLDRLRRVWSVSIFPANKDEIKCFKRGLERVFACKIAPNAKIVIGDRYFDSQEFREYCNRVFNVTLCTLKKNPKRKFNLVEDEIKAKFLESKMKSLINPFRYIIEQFFAHLEKARRLVMVYERKYTSYLGFVNLRVVLLLLRRMRV